MKVKDILKITDAEIAAAAKLRPEKILRGTGVIKLRADQQMINRLSQTPVFNRGVRGAVNFYKQIDDDKQIVKMHFPKSETLRKNYDEDLSNPEKINPTAYFLSKLRLYKNKLISDPSKAKNVMLEMKDSFQELDGQLKSPKKAAASASSRQAKLPIENGQTAEQLSDLLNSLLTSFRDNVTGFEYSRFRINEVAQYDFNEFRFLKEPDFVTVANSVSLPLDFFVNRAIEIVRQVVEGNPPTMRQSHYETYYEEYEIDDGYQVGVLSQSEDILVDDGEVVDVQTKDYLIRLFVQLFLDHLASDLYELENRIISPQDATTLSAFNEWFFHLYQNNDWSLDSVHDSSDNPELWADALDEILYIFNNIYPNVEFGEVKYNEGNGYDFRPYSSDSVAFGINLNYKQNWSPLGVQSGETVKTVPLGPKQVEKITTKTTSLIKKLSTRETFTSIETSSETTDTSKLTTDIVNDSQSKLTTELDTKVSGPIEMVNVEVGTKVGTELSAASKETKNQLNEKMEKTATKMKNDIRVSVSNEFQSTSEYDRSTEISNPNDDIAITYIYSKLLQQYELVTFLNEVTNVVFVPERLPSTDEIQRDWIRKYDWIIAKNLLDDSFQADLTALLNDNEEGENEFDSDFDTAHFKNVSQTAVNSHMTYSNYQGGEVDIFQSQNEIYLRQLDKIRVLKERRRNTDKSFRRLKEHIKCNILHYMRAIWLTEDKDQRLLRYNERLVPTKWVFVPDRNPLQSDQDGSFMGNFVPDFSSASLKRLSSIIDPSGPVGFSGNCLVFNMKSNPDLMNLNEGLRAVKAHYIKYKVEVRPAKSEKIEIIHASAVYSGFPKPTFSVKYDPQLKWRVTEHTHKAKINVIHYNERTIYFDGVVITFASFPTGEIEFEVKVFPTDFLQDPEEKYLPLSNELPRHADRDIFWSDELINDMLIILPGLSAKLSNVSFAGMDEASKLQLYKYYYEYLYKKSNTKRITVDTGNLMLDILVSDNVVLEDFKRIHRVVDVMKAMEEEVRLKLENERRRKRLESDDLADPDIENVHTVNIQNPIVP